MSSKITFSGDFKKRLAKLPALMNGLIRAKLKKDAVELVKIFHDGIKRNTLSLQKLSRVSIDAKGRMNFPAPETPLYGRGDEKKEKSYMNLLRIKETKAGYTVQPSIGRHWKSNLRLKDLFHVHEYGALIAQGEGATARMIRIPPRPAFLKSYQLWGKKRIKDETSKTVKNAIQKYLADGKANHIAESKAALDRGIDSYFRRLTE